MNKVLGTANAVPSSLMDIKILIPAVKLLY